MQAGSALGSVSVFVFGCRVGGYRFQSSLNPKPVQVQGLEFMILGWGFGLQGLDSDHG